MRFVLAIFTVATAAAQIAVNPKLLPPDVKFEPAPEEQRVNCDVRAFRPYIDFGFRFRASYVMGIPLAQYEGKGHSWGIVTRITPEAGGEPTHLIDMIHLPEVPKTKLVAEVGQGFLLGEGRYRVDVVLVDDKARRCHGSFKLEAKRQRGDRNVTLRIDPNTARSVVMRYSAADAPKADERPYKISVLVNVAPMYPRATRLRPYDRDLVLGALGPLLDQLPSQSVRLVMFSLEQQKTIFERDNFRLEDMAEVLHALNGLELGTVPYSVLKNKVGHIQQIAQLIGAESKLKDSPDAVIFLGPLSRYIDKFPPFLAEPRAATDPKFFYVQYRPPMERGPVFSDLIENAVKGLKGKTFHVHSPGEFASALKQIDRNASGDGRN